MRDRDRDRRRESERSRERWGGEIERGVGGKENEREIQSCLRTK